MVEDVVVAGRDPRTGRFPSATGHGPARRYSWKPFEKGNQAALKHGARSRSDDRWRPIAEEIKAELHEHYPWTKRPEFAVMAEQYAEAAAREQLVDRWLDEVGFFDENGEPRAAMGSALRYGTRAGNLLGKMGCTPLDLARMAKRLLVGATPEERDAIVLGLGGLTEGLRESVKDGWVEDVARLRGDVVADGGVLRHLMRPVR